MNKLNGNELRELEILCNKYNCNFADTLALVEGDQPEENFMLSLLKEDTNATKIKVDLEDDFLENLLASHTPKIRRDFKRALRNGDIQTALKLLDEAKRREKPRSFRK